MLSRDGFEEGFFVSTQSGKAEGSSLCLRGVDQNPAPDQFFKVLNDVEHRAPFADDHAQFHVSVEGVVCQVCTADYRRIVNNRTLCVQLARSACRLRRWLRIEIGLTDYRT